MASIILKMTVCMAVACMAVMGGAEATLTCGGVVQNLKPCIQYLKSSGGGAAPLGSCCEGVRTVKKLAQTTQDRRTACQCMKTAAAKMQGFKYGVASKLPAQCGVSVGYMFSPNLNCNTVQ
uniref:Non-specific lipid-transfer protein n=1 Tax=Opuntia streptacantha TaxID=393608 RepID=A0A7C8ZLX2_OPUST